VTFFVGLLLGFGWALFDLQRRWRALQRLRHARTLLRAWLAETIETDLFAHSNREKL